jgi:hypothetical protein
MKAAPLLFFLITTGCPDTRHSVDDGPVMPTYFVHGDPNELIAGAKAESTSPITEANADEWAQYSLARFARFVEREQVIRAPRAVAKKHFAEQYKSKDGAGELHANKSAVVVSQSTEQTWEMSLLGGELVFELARAADGRLQPALVRDKNSKLPVEVVHWSMTPDKN